MEFKIVASIYFLFFHEAYYELLSGEDKNPDSELLDSKRLETMIIVLVVYHVLHYIVVMIYYKSLEGKEECIKS